jgi:hypothetical protein
VGKMNINKYLHLGSMKSWKPFFFGVAHRTWAFKNVSNVLHLPKRIACTKSNIGF